MFVVLGAAAIPMAVAALWWGVAGDRTGSATATRNMSAGLTTVRDMREALLQHSARDRVVDPLIARLAARARRVTPGGMLEALERRILLAGAPASWPLERVLAAKLGLAVLALAVSLLRLQASPSALVFLEGVILIVLGFFLPDLLLHSQSQKRQEAVELALPDTLDQITVSVEAGLGLEAAMARAATKGKGPLAAELARTLQDIRAGMSRGEALRGLGDRTQVTDLNRFVLALIQAESYGVPVSKVLRVQSAELRMKRRQRAEERAMKLPVKVLMPLVLCILPTMFIVLLGPAAIRIAHMFRGLH